MTENERSRDTGPGGLTGAARERVERELATLRDQRRELAAGLGEQDVGDRGDEADAAERGDDLVRLDERIATLRDVLIGNEPDATGPGSAEPRDGTEVTLRFPDGAVRTLTVVARTEEADAADQDAVLTADSPLGMALAGHRPGDRISYPTPGGTRQVELVSLVPPTEPGGAPRT